MNNSRLSQKHKELLAVIQSNFPVNERPFREIADLLGWTESKVIDAIHTLIENGIIRAFGPVFDARKLGYESTLIAAEVDNDRTAEISEAIDDINEITHNYLRDNEFNMWFTISARNESIMGNIISWTEQFHGVSRILNLSSVKVYKVNAVFGAAETAQPAPIKNTEFWPFNEAEQSFVKLLQENFPINKNPFKTISKSFGLDESIIIYTVKYWLDNGVIRRFGARLDHHLAGYTANSMSAWKCGDCNTLGHTFAALPHVSHCYRRQAYSDWPYELYTMVHARSESELDKLLHQMKSAAPEADMISLNTIKELKKTTMKYFMEDGRWDSPLQG